ncbi:MAG: NnrU family protein [Pirellulales bacterium]
MDAKLRWDTPLWRVTGYAIGIGTQLCFAVTVVFLFLYLRYGGSHESENWLTVDTVLALQFAIVHSLILLPSSRALINKFVPSQLYGNLFCVATCIGLWLVFAYWQVSTSVVWDATGWAQTAVLTGFYSSWISLLLSLRLTGFGYQTGWTQWLHWVRREALPRRPFVERGAYRWLRHPVYLSFLGLIWFTPRMTADHVVLTGVWTAYIFLGSFLKDRRLVYYLGDTYRDYASRVPGYPGMVAGPLAKWERPVVAKKAA